MKQRLLGIDQKFNWFHLEAHGPLNETRRMRLYMKPSWYVLRVIRADNRYNHCRYRGHIDTVGSTFHESMPLFINDRLRTFDSRF